MINPTKLLKLKGAWDVFSQNHPKFPQFMKAVHKSGVQEGTIIEINVTNPDGKILSSNMKLKESDTKLFAELSELLNNL